MELRCFFKRMLPRQTTQHKNRVVDQRAGLKMVLSERNVSEYINVVRFLKFITSSNKRTRKQEDKQNDLHL